MSSERSSRALDRPSPPRETRPIGRSFAAAASTAAAAKESAEGRFVPAPQGGQPATSAPRALKKLTAGQDRPLRRSIDCIGKRVAMRLLAAGCTSQFASSLQPSPRRTRIPTSAAASVCDRNHSPLCGAKSGMSGLFSMRSNAWRGLSLFAFVLVFAAAIGCTEGKKRIVFLTNGSDPFWDACRSGLEEGARQFEIEKAGYTV